MSFFNEGIEITILNNKVELDIECWNCDGGKEKPKEPFVKEDGTCEQCDGTGFQLTPVGESILKLIDRHRLRM